MYFPGEARNAKKVDLGGRSSKEKDRSNYLQQTRIAREQRQRQRRINYAVTVIQRCFRGRMVVATAKSTIREKFCRDFGEFGERADRTAFKPTSKYLQQLLFFYESSNNEDIQRLIQVCRLLLQLVKESGNIEGIFDYGDNQASSVIKYRIEQLTLCCLQALHQIREHVKLEITKPPGYADLPGLLLLETVLVLTEYSLPWAENTMRFILHNYTFRPFREILLMMQDLQGYRSCGEESCIEQLLMRLSSYSAKNLQSEENIQLSFSIQILSFPFLWKQFPYIKQVIACHGLLPLYVKQISTVLSSLSHLLPPDASPDLPSCSCLLGNLLEVSVDELRKNNCTLQMAADSANVLQILFSEQSAKSLNQINRSSDVEDDMDIDEDISKKLNKYLKDQIFGAVEEFSLELVRYLCECDHAVSKGRDETEIIAVNAICAFLDVAFTVIPFDRIISNLAYKTEFIPKLWLHIKHCHLNGCKPSIEAFSTYSTADPPGWILAISVFCPVYRHMLMIIDNEEFYEKQKPLSLDDVRLLVNILKEVLWYLLWVFPSKQRISQKIVKSSPQSSILQSIPSRVSTVAAELLAQLQDWNCRNQFIPFEEFHAREAVDGHLISQAGAESATVSELLKKAPFLVPFTTRVQIYTSQLTAVKTQSNRLPFPRQRITIRRSRFIDDAFNELNDFSAEELKGMIRVTFINEHGEEEAGVDGGGLFKEFMENITKTGFDIQYGLFKETADHLLYPNPASGTVHPDHLQYFEFLGKILGKAMFEGILVDIPFTTFFLSKLKEKHNYLHDLPSLDPELYKNLLKLKHYDGDISELGLYFVSENNEFGEQTEVELLPGGKDMQVTNTSIIRFIHLVANHRLNSQIRNQSSAFLRGLQQLIRPDWIAMFNEHELQLLISGSTDGVDVDDLQANTNYSGGYDEKHQVIVMFWEVLKEFTMDQRRKFLKFVTGCSRGPLLGFKYLEPGFCIQRAAPEDAPEAYLDRLPTSGTCANLLKLPPYKSKEVLKRKLLYSISSDAGFDLS